MSPSDTENLYSDYEKIVPSEELPQFLFHWFSALKEVPWVKDNKERTYGEKVYCRELQLSVQKYNKYKPLLGFFDKVLLSLYIKGTGKSKKNILFHGAKYLDIILETKKHQHVGLLAHGKKERLLAAKNFMGYVDVNDLDQYVLAYLKEKNIKYLYRLVSEVEKKLTALKPDYIVLWNDALPIESAIVLASRKLGITTIEIQHGVYFDSSLPAGTRSIVDHLLVWGKHFKNLYVRSRVRDPEGIHILGYPYSIGKRDIPRKREKYTVCWLGENFETFNENLLPVKIEIVNTVSKICGKKGLNFVYRPHPGDDRELLAKEMPDIRFTPRGEKLDESFKNADIFISFVSTSLAEAAMRSRISLQLLKYPIIAPNYEKLGVCNKTFQTYNELEDCLARIASSPDLNKFKLNFNNDYVETRYNPGRRFLEIVEEIGRSNFNKNKFKA